MRAAIAIGMVLAACGGGGDARDAAPGADAPAFPFPQRPYTLVVPSGYTPGTPTPLVVLLHGYSATGALQEAYFKIGEVAEAETFLYAIPDGTVDGSGNQFWNATDACCDLGGIGVDDVGYLHALLDDVAARYTVDPKRVYFIGHSNGGFMSHRMACDLADRVAGIVSLAGAVWADPARCPAVAPVAVAQVHGDGDTTILYAGGSISGRPYPSAAGTTATWATKNGCTGMTDGTPLDLAANVAGDETTIQRATGCTAGGAAELWTIAGAGHIPSFTTAWAPSVWAFFEAHPKP